MPEFNYLTTHLGSVPHPEPGDLPGRLADMLDIPAWTQHPKRSFRESMYVQFATNLPGVVVDEIKEKIFFIASGDTSPALENFYGSYLAEIGRAHV